MELIQPLNDTLFPAQTVAYTGTAGSTNGWQSGPSAVLVWATTAAYVTVGDGVTATTSSTPIPANVPVKISVPVNATKFRVSAIQVSSGGSVYAKPLNEDRS